jgi:hypothetical protein
LFEEKKCFFDWGWGDDLGGKMRLDRKNSASDMFLFIITAFFAFCQIKYGGISQPLEFHNPNHSPPAKALLTVKLYTFSFLFAYHRAAIKNS